MDDQRTVNVNGATAAPNQFTITLGPEDHAQFAEIGVSLARALEDEARTHAREQGYRFLGPVEVVLNRDDDLRVGSFGLSARVKEGAGGTAGGSLLLPAGDRITLADTTVTIGRAVESTIRLKESSVSRTHAEIRPTGDGGWQVVDLRSTNGTRVNGVAVTDRRLSDGDSVTIGDTVIRFEAG
jgi:hypothetical protein